MNSCRFFTFLLASLAAGPALAQPPSPGMDAGLEPAPPATVAESRTTGGAPVPTREAADRVRVAVSPYAWLTGFAGTVGLRGIETDISKSFFDVLDASDSVFGLMGALDIDVDRFVLQLNGSWVTAELSDERGDFSTGSIAAEVELDASWTEIFAGYRFHDAPLGRDPESGKRLALDVFAGGRYTTVDFDATLRATSEITLPDGQVVPSGASASRDRSEGWLEPFFGVRGIVNLDEHWVIQLRGDVGGFGIDDSDFSWQAVTVIGYQWKLDGWNLGLFGGYRALGQNYSENDFEWDMVTHGALFGASAWFHF